MTVFIASTPDFIYKINDNKLPTKIAVFKLDKILGSLIMSMLKNSFV